MLSTATSATRTAPRPSFVDRALVHKHHDAEVLLTGWRPEGGAGFVVSAHWPAAHAYYATGRTALDPLLLGETVRQCLPLLCHGAFDVPLGHHLLWDTYSYELTPAALLPKDRAGAVELHVTCRELARRGTRAAALTLEFTVVRDGERLAVCGTRLTVQAPAVYQRLRAGRGTPAAVTPLPSLAAVSVDPSELGRTGVRDVALAPAEGAGRWLLRVDPTHPLFFDHPVDHAPGMLLLEAARQAAALLDGPHAMTVAGMRTSFVRYVELDALCEVVAAPPVTDAEGQVTTRVVLRQNGAEHFAATATLVPRPRPLDDMAMIISPPRPLRAAHPTARLRG